jgi:probable rRNA maturation factor
MMKRTHDQDRESDSDDEAPLRILNRQRFRRVDRNALTRFARRVLAEIDRGESRATITLVGDHRIQELNRTYRGLDQPTDVLSFPNEPDFPHEASRQEDLGDVIISTETAARYAGAFGISFDRELKNLIIHGLLHLCGYDHETDQGQMRQLERRLRRRLIKGERSALSPKRTEC